MYRSGDEKPDQQTIWSEEQIEDLVLGLLESEKGKAILARVLLGHLAHHEPIKEEVARVARQLSGVRSIEEIERGLDELEIDEPSTSAIFMRPLWDNDPEIAPEMPIFDQTAFGNGD
jgi:hypothetical protein